VEVATYNSLSDAIDCNVDTIVITDDITITNEIHIENQTVVIIGQNTPTLTSTTSRVFYIVTSDVNMSNLTINGGQLLSDNGAAILCQDSTLDLFNIDIINGKAVNGGAIYMENSAISTYSSVFYGNIASSSGGAVYCTASGRLTLSASSVFRNTGNDGGALNFFNCELNIMDSHVYNNSASRFGGCVYAVTSKVSMENALFSDCSVATAVSGLDDDSQGGCIYAVSDSELSITSSTLANCSSGIGAILKLSSSTGHLENSSFVDSRAVRSIVEAIGVSTLLTVHSSRFADNTASMEISALRCGMQSVCRVRNSVFENNFAAFSGGLSVDYSALAHLTSCTFRDNSAGNSGGAISLSYAANVTCTGCSFERNSAVQYGGACALSGGSHMTFEDCEFLSNSAESGGALSVDFVSNIVVRSSTFVGDYVRGTGGSVSIIGSSSAAIHNSSFTGCIAVYGAAVYVNSHSSVSLERVHITDSIAEYEGGCLAAYAYSTVDILDCDFIGNEAVYGGGIFGQLYTTFNITTSRLHMNTAHYVGGAAVIQDNSYALIVGVSFLDNIANYNGAGVAATFSRVNIIDSVGEGNYCGYNGAIFHGMFSTLEISRSTFTGNTAEIGGCISCGSNSTCITRNNTFRANTATYGGALSLQSSSWTSLSDVFDLNSVTASGGAVFSNEFVSASLLNASVKKCTAYVGGALSLSVGEYLSITDSDFSENSATVIGGALYIDSVNTYLSSTTIVHNVALYYGAGAAFIGSKSSLIDSTESNSMTVNISASTFDSNDAKDGSGAGVYGSGVDLLTISQCSISNNSAAFGGGLSTTGTHGVVQHTEFINNAARYGGGGVYWVVQTNGSKIYVDDATCSEFNNTALYGAFKATDVAKLGAIRYVDTAENSGSQISHPIYIDMLDFYNQIVVDDGTGYSRVIYSSTVDETSSIQGTTIVETKNGVATFGNITVTNKPSSMVTLKFDLSAGVEAYYNLSFRACVVGEIETFLVGSTSVCTKCSPGTYSLKLNAETCHQCPDNAICRGGDDIKVDSGYWRLGQEYDGVHLCPYKEACKGGSNTSTQCKKGHEGMYCSVCERGYYQRAGRCTSCKSSGNELLMTIVPSVLLALILFSYYLYLNRDKIRDFITKKIVEMADTADQYKFGAIKTKFKIILAFVQIINQLPFVLNVDFPFTYIKFLEILWVFNLDFVEFLNFDCLYYRNFYDKLVTATTGPFVLVGTIVLILRIRHSIAFRMNETNPSYSFSQFKNDSIFLSLLVSFVVFSPVSIKLLQTFACESFEDGSSRLIADYSIECKGAEYEFYVGYASIFTVVYPIGVPMMYLALLVYNHDKVNPRTNLVVREDERHLVSSSVIQEEKINLRHTFEDIKIISFLYETYEPQRWYFEVGDCFRRLSLTAVPVLIMRGSSTQIVLVLCVSLACVGAYMELKPFITESDNLVAVVTQWAITLTLIVAIMIRVNESDGINRNVLGLLAILINSSVFVLTIVLIFLADDAPDGMIEKVREESRKRAQSQTNKLKLSEFIEEHELKQQGQDSNERPLDSTSLALDSARRASAVDPTSLSARRSSAVDPTSLSARRGSAVDPTTSLSVRRGSAVDPTTSLSARRGSAVDPTTSLPARRASVTKVKNERQRSGSEDGSQKDKRRGSIVKSYRKGGSPAASPSRTKGKRVSLVQNKRQTTEKDSDDDSDSDECVETINPIAASPILARHDHSKRRSLGMTSKNLHDEL